MKIFIILILLTFKQLCCENLSTSNHVCNECEQKNLQLLHENSQLHKTNGELKNENGQFHKTIADLRAENTNLNLELQQMREKSNSLTEELDWKYVNCTALTSEAQYVSENFQSLTKQLKEFNSFFDMQSGYFTSAKERIAKSMKGVETHVDKKMDVKFATVEEIVIGCEPQKISGLTFVNRALCEKACNFEKSNGEWTVIQRRNDGSTNFNRPWADYKAGFGTMSGEFFIGLDSLHLLTTCAPQELRIEMEDYENVTRYAKYNLFEIGDETEKFAMKILEKYEGDAGDSLNVHRSRKFSTFDQDNDGASFNCAETFKGGWWYEACHQSNLNGEYGNKEYGRGINWYTFHDYNYTLKRVEMKIRPKNKNL